VKSTSSEAPRYAVFSSLLPLLILTLWSIYSPQQWLSFD